MVAAKYGTNEQAGEVFKQISLCNNCLQLGLLRLAVGLALQLPTLAKKESPAGSCNSQSRWELSGSQSEMMERDTMCNSSFGQRDWGWGELTSGSLQPKSRYHRQRCFRKVL